MNRFVLGTAQFGMAYGATNQQGMLSEKEVFQILDCALENDISYFDTSILYGKSLERLGNFFRNQSRGDVHVINKFSLCDDFDQTLSSLQTFLEDSGLTSYEALLIHDPDQIGLVDKKKLNLFVQRVLELQLTTKMGCSVYSHRELNEVMQFFPVQVVQCPANPFQTDFLDTAVVAKDVEVHARSLFLQGVLLASALPSRLQFLEPYVQEYRNILHDADINDLEALLGWALQQGGIHKWVFGVTSVAELEQIVQTSLKVKKSSKKIDFSPLAKYKDQKDLDPTQWNQHE